MLLVDVHSVEEADGDAAVPEAAWRHALQGRHREGDRYFFHLGRRETTIQAEPGDTLSLRWEDAELQSVSAEEGVL